MPSGLYSRRWLAGCCLALTCLGSPVVVADGFKPGDTFQDWTAGCEQIGGREMCFIGQIVARDGDRKPVMKGVFSRYPDTRDRYTLVLTLPLGVMLGPGIQMQIDDGDRFNAAFWRCTPEGCHALVLVDERGLEKLQKGAQLKITFLGPKDKPATFILSLAGFTKGSASLP